MLTERYEEDPFLAHLEKLQQDSYCVIENYISPEEVRMFRYEISELEKRACFKPAGIGRGQDLRKDIRGDKIYWIEENSPSPVQKLYLQKLEEIKERVNRYFFMGLFSVELHYAIYPPGSFYLRHLDNFLNSNKRMLTAVLYLNKFWEEFHGGLLKIYKKEKEYKETIIEVPPSPGTLVLFLSRELEHEVSVCYVNRYSLTSWFKVR
ncbi:MAG: 2OG-Fe(II) oxygenase [Leptospiraceae bacterium]|nr:2OG-Fe(II) oxygenase [Leptospiraceae bacterium]MCP5499335.1 2OG-Fe(II) oxygenase [Leptospiraceae bacterium]